MNESVTARRKFLVAEVYPFALVDEWIQPGAMTVEHMPNKL